MKEITLGSLFDGIGGFPYAASFYGIRSLWASEVLPECVSVTRRHFPEMEHMGDITRLHGCGLPPADIITFGSPCQGLSTAGRRKGLADERSGLFTEAVRIIYEMREATHGRCPKFVLWENVPGAFSSAGGRDYQAVLEAVTKAWVPMPGSGKWANAGMVRGGGADIAWVVYDAQYFGTAQRRRRVFLVADFTGRRAGEILFVPQSLRGHPEAGRTPGQETAGPAGGSAGGPGGAAGDSGVYCIAGNTIGRQSGNGGNGAGCQRELAYTLTATDRHAVTAAGPERSIRRIPKDQGGSFAAPERDAVFCMASGQSHAEILWDQSPTLNRASEQPYIVGMAGRAGYIARRLTPLECERLQGFPDGWTLQGHDGRRISDTKRYQMLGNSIAVPCAAYIMQGICRVLAGA